MKLKSLVVPAVALLMSTGALGLPFGSIDGIVEMREQSSSSSSGDNALWKMLLGGIFWWGVWKIGCYWSAKRDARKRAWRAAFNEKYGECHWENGKAVYKKNVNGKWVTGVQPPESGPLL